MARVERCDGKAGLFAESVKSRGDLSSSLPWGARPESSDPHSCGDWSLPEGDNWHKKLTTLAAEFTRHKQSLLDAPKDDILTISLRFNDQIQSKLTELMKDVTNADPESNEPASTKREEIMKKLLAAREDEINTLKAKLEDI
jgi:hypothetical protein